ncbi:MAG: TetR/AcrR family transcriptional regulator [Eubacteriales bacterium]
MKKVTKSAILESFVTLLNKKSIRRITVKDLARSCGINRNTFYYYFTDIYRVLDEVLEIELQHELEAQGDFDGLSLLFWRRVSFASQNRNAIRNLYQNMNRDQFDRYLYSGLPVLMQRFVAEQAQGLSVSDEVLEEAARLCQNVLVGLVLEWVYKGMKEDLCYGLQRLMLAAKPMVHTILTEPGIHPPASCEPNP